MVTLIAVRVTMIAPNHMFKVDLSRFLWMQMDSFLIL